MGIRIYICHFLLLVHLVTNLHQPPVGYSGEAGASNYVRS